MKPCYICAGPHEGTIRAVDGDYFHYAIWPEESRLLRFNHEPIEARQQIDGVDYVRMRRVRTARPIDFMVPETWMQSDLIDYLAQEAFGKCFWFQEGACHGY